MYLFWAVTLMYTSVDYFKNKYFAVISAAFSVQVRIYAAFAQAYM